MIADEKRQIILDEGIPVEVYDYNNNLMYTTTALLGKATSNNTSEITHENQRKALFLPEVFVPNGSIVINTVTSEKYVALASFEEVYGTERIANISRLVEANATVTITAYAETADEYGNITKGNITKISDLPVHVRVDAVDLVQYKPGLYENADYLVYMSAVDIDTLDQFHVTKGPRTTLFKVEHTDYMTFDGVALVSVCTDARK